MFKTVKHTVRFLLGNDQPSSQTTEAERACLRRHVNGCALACEIGVYEGLTSRLIAESMLETGKLYAIDPFFPGRIGICWSEIIARRHVANADSKAQVYFIKKFSYEALNDVPNELDFVFIDGDHSIDGIRADWRDWSGKVAELGVIALHDTSPSPYNERVAKLGSCKYFAEHIRHDARFEIIETVDSLNVLRRI